MITTALYYLDTTGIPTSISHLYEHLIISGFHTYLEKRGMSPYLFGYLHGETFDECIYLDLGCYSPDVAELLDEYLHETHHFEHEQIQNQFKVLEAEDMAHIAYNSSAIQTTLSKLDLEKWVHNDDIHIDEHDIYQNIDTDFIRSEDSDSFQDIVVALYSKELNEHEQKVFLRLYVIIIDMLEYWLRRRYSGYKRGASSINFDSTIMGVIASFTISNTFQCEEINKELNKFLANFDVNMNFGQIDTHFKVFASTPTFNNIAVEYYKNTGIHTSTNEIARLADNETIKSLFDKVRINVRPHDSQDNDIIF